MTKCIMALQLALFIFPVFGEGIEPPGESLVDNLESLLADNAVPVFQIGIIARTGTYYKPGDDGLSLVDLPEPGGIGVVLNQSKYGTEDNKGVYYYVQGRGWEGWVHSVFFESTGIPLSGTINTVKLNVRSGPSTKFGVAGKTVEGDRVFIYERSDKEETIGGDSGYWYRVGEGKWVFGAYVDLTPNYDLIWLLSGRERGPREIAPETVEAVVNGIINAPPRQFSFDLPPDWSGIKPIVDTKNASYQSQALYWAALRLLNNTDKESFKWATFYAEQLGEHFADNNVYDWGYGFEYPAAAEAAQLRVLAYKKSDDRKLFRETLLEVYPIYGWVEYNRMTYSIYSGFEILDFTKDYVLSWGPTEAADFFLELAEVAPNRLLRAAIELEAGKTLASSSDRGDVARGQNILWAIIEEYPLEERLIYIIDYNYAQSALVEYVRSLPDDDRRRLFLLKYSGDATPFPVRYCALYLLAYGDDGYDSEVTFGPLDTGYRELYDSIHIEDKYYWFSDYMDVYGE